MTSLKVSLKTILIFACFIMLIFLALFHASFSVRSDLEHETVPHHRDATLLVEQMRKELNSLKSISSSIEKDISSYNSGMSAKAVGTQVQAVQTQAPVVVRVSAQPPPQPQTLTAPNPPRQAPKMHNAGTLPSTLPSMSFSVSSGGTDWSAGDGGGSMLVVGGTDGSGSRRVVSLLVALGVPMVSEDPETYDIHADLVGGWPKMVTPLLRATRSLKYNPSNLPLNLQKTTAGSIRKVLGKIKADLHKREGSRLREAGVLRRPEGATAGRVDVGFKAPVSMTLVPYIVALEPRVMFLHVLRDGRDIAFSANQGPVTKFYEPMYRERPSSAPLSGIKLWSDWNSQLHHWARDVASSPAAFYAASGSQGTGFGYLALHSEDLVDPVTAVRFGAIVNLAAWVGSSLTDDELCCLAVQESVFLGSHDRSAGRGTAKINAGARYGKWKAKVGGNGKLGSQLHEHGREGLRTFGYEPARQLAEEGAVSTSGYQCTLTPQDCSSILKKPEVQFTAVDVCKISPGTDYKGGDIGGSPQTVANLDECCRACKVHKQCRHFTYVPDKCYLKVSQGTAQFDPNRLDGMVSGDIL